MESFYAIGIGAKCITLGDNYIKERYYVNQLKCATLGALRLRDANLCDTVMLLAYLTHVI